MDIVEQIASHRSVRAFTGEPVSEAALERILGAATRASTGGGMQLYSMMVTCEPAEREVLAAIHLGSDTVRHAPLVVTFCVDTHRLSRWIELQGERPGLDNVWGFAIGFSDALLAAQNAILAAEAEGLGGCFLGSTFVAAGTLARFFGCPRGVVPVATLVLGHPAEDPAPGTRLPLHAVVHRGRYGEPDPRELEAMYDQHAKATFERFRKTSQVGALVRASGVDNLAAYYATLTYPGELNATAGAYFMAAVESQGFVDDQELARVRALRQAGESATIAALHPMRQIAFSMALMSGHVDAVLSLSPADAERAVSSFCASVDPALLDDFVQAGPFDPRTRTRFYRVLAQFSRQSEVGAAAAE